VTGQFLLFLVVGVAQYAIDALLFAVLFFLGVPVGLANVAARGTAAVAGFQLNGRLTFRDQRGEQGWRISNGIKFLTLWIGMTVASTALMLAAAQLFESLDLSGTWIVAAKLVVEGFLAVLSFSLSKWWVFTR
jgi:putative flippase GtrA